MRSQPVATAGIPVYQGENFLDETLTALRKQDYENLEIVICDNASTDRTMEIARSHADDDDRIKLIENVENIGAAANYNKVFYESDGKYFAWNAHDDYSSPDFFASAVAALESNPDAVVAIPNSYRVNINGVKIERFPIPDEIFSEAAHSRFRAAARAHPEVIVFGLFRRSSVAATPLHGRFAGSDRIFVAELMLHGPPVMAGTSEFYLREHPGRSVRKFHRGGPKNRFSHDRDAWYAPERKGRLVFPAWRRLGQYFAAVYRAPLGLVESARCYLAIGRLLLDDDLKLLKQLVYDLVVAGYTLGRKAKNTVDND